MRQRGLERQRRGRGRWREIEMRWKGRKRVREERKDRVRPGGKEEGGREERYEVS